MIERKHLRLGNIIMYEQTAHVIDELHETKALHTWRRVDRHWTRYDIIEGFPLTAEWLRKFGFKLASDEEHLYQCEQDELFQIGVDSDTSYCHIWDAAYTGALPGASATLP